MSSALVDVVGDAAVFRRELTAYCYRMLGSATEAEDAAQEALVRAWRGAESFEGRSSLRTWLYKIATNICLDMRRAPQRRALPMDMTGPSTVDGELGRPLGETVWIEPIHSSRVLPDAGDPADAAVLRDSVRLAFLAALQHLPPRQRAVLVLREVLDWSAAEVAELLGTSVASVTSALARARATMATLGGGADRGPIDAEHRALLDRYVSAFEAYDVAGLVSLLHEDATFSMPPYEFWLLGPAEVTRWYAGPGEVCRNSRIVETTANGAPAFAAYHLVKERRWEPFALHLLDVRGRRIAGICHFLDVSIFPAFGLPDALTN